MKRSLISNKSQSFHSISIDENDSLGQINKVGFEPTDHTPTQYDLENDKKIHILKELQSAILPHGWQSIFDQILGKSSKQEPKFTDFLPNKVGKKIFTFNEKNIITKNCVYSSKKINNTKSLRNSFRFREELKIVNDKNQSRQISPSANHRARQDSKLVVPQKQQHNLKQNLMIFNKKKPSKYTELSTNSQKSSQGLEQNQSFIPSSKVSSQSIQFDSIKEINKTMDICYIRRKSCYCSQCGDLNQFQFKSSNLQTQLNQKGRIRVVRSMKKSVTCGSQSRIVHKFEFVYEKKTVQEIITRPSILENVSPVDDTISPLRFDRLRSYNKIKLLPNMKDNLLKRNKAYIKSKFRSQKINIIINDPIIAVKQPKINREQMNGYFISQIKGKSMKQLQTVQQILEPQRTEKSKNNKYSFSNQFQSVKSQMEPYKQLNKQMNLTSSSYLTNIYTPKSIKSSILYPNIQPYSLSTVQSQNVLSKIQQKLLSQLNQNNSPNKQFIPKLQVLKVFDRQM